MKLNEKGVDLIQDIMEKNIPYLSVSVDAFMAGVERDLYNKAPELDLCEGGEVYKMIMEFVENE